MARIDITRRQNRVGAAGNLNAMLAEIKGSALTVAEKVSLEGDSPRQIQSKIIAIVLPKLPGFTIDLVSANRREFPLRINAAMTAAYIAIARDPDLYPYAPRGVPGRLVNEGNAKVVSASSTIGTYGKSRMLFHVPPTAMPTDEIVPLFANWALPSGTGSFSYGTVGTLVSGSPTVTVTAGPLPDVGVVVTGTGIPASTVVDSVNTGAGTFHMATATGTAVNATASNTGIAITTNNIGEVKGGAATLEALIIDNGAGQRTTFPFGGSTGPRAVTAGETFIGDRGVKLSDLGLVAGQSFFVETCDFRAVGTLRPGGYRSFVAQGEGYIYGTTTQVGSTVTGTAKTASTWAPLTFLFSGKPANVKAHALLGDSIAMGVSSVLGTNFNSKGEQGYIPIAMLAVGDWYVNMTKDGTKASEAGGPPTNLAGGTFTGRAAVLTMLKSVAAGAVANLDVINELVTNDTTASLATLQDRLNSLFNKVIPFGLKIKQLSSLLQANSTDYFASNGNQTTAAVTAVGSYIPTQAATAAQRDFLAASGGAGVESWFAGLVGTTLAANFNSRPQFAQAASGAGSNLWQVTRAALTMPTGGVGAAATTMPAPVGALPGDWLVFEPGTTNQEVKQISDIAANVVTLTAATQFAHAAGVTLQPAPSGDGLHPSPDNHARVGAIMGGLQAFKDFLAA